ncbi:MAG: ERCC4 domain-containing protein [Planctomycetota bacterium]
MSPPGEPRAERHPEAPQERVAIVVDCREPPGLPALVETHWEPVLVRRLSVGDVSVGRVLVERKEAHDFVMCLRSGRLFRQVYSLRGASARPLVILEGDPYALVGPDHVRSLKGALLSLLTGYGIPVLRTRDLENTAESLIQIAHQESKRAGRRAWKGQLDEAPGGSPCPARAPPPDPRALSILEALPDVGPVRPMRSSVASDPSTRS